MSFFHQKKKEGLKKREWHGLMVEEGLHMKNRIIDKTILFAFGIVLIWGNPNWIEPVSTILIAFILACLGLYIEQSIYLTVVTVGCLFLCVGYPDFSLFLPLMVYDCVLRKRKLVFLAPLPFIYAMSNYENWKILLWVISLVLSIYLAYRTLQNEKLSAELIRIRDNSAELNMILKEKNKNLMEKQDYEIHLATLRERNRIAREIHDNVGHMLSRSILQIGALTTIHKEEPLNGQLQGINQTLNTAMNNIRESVHDLHDDSIDLRQAIGEALQSMEEEYKIQFDYDMSAGVPSNIKYGFLTIIKEALSNVVKHSDADTIRVLLREHPAFYQLAIEDNGSKEPSNLEGGIGLNNMKERVETLQGSIHFKYEKGFQILISVRKEEKA